MNFCIIAAVLSQFAIISFADVSAIDYKGINQINGRVVGGRNAVDGERPFQVALYSNNTFICGGSLLYPRVVVTAAHCIGGNLNKIRYNTLNRSNGPTIDIIKTIIFPGFNPINGMHDIALVILKTAFKPDKNAKVIDIMGVVARNGTILTLSGWGNTISNGGVKESESLKVANLTEVDRQTCNKMWNNEVPISEFQICASASITTNSACQGDSGGPLTWNGKLYGIVSYVHVGCPLDKSPNVYTRVGNYLAFIKDNVNREKLN